MILHNHEFATSKIQHIDVNKLLNNVIKIIFYTTGRTENILHQIVACSIVSAHFYKLK